MFLGSYLVRDLSYINKPEILKKVHQSTRFSVSFILLLIGSSVVCTLGLLANSTAIVIGGMIISPLMWPLMQAAIGISYGRIVYIRRSLFLLGFSVLVSLGSAFFITYLSPIKVLNAEILSRTTPTLIDIAIAIVAGGVAALAITQPRISESLAGVAIATSLMPPICVSGIGLALLNTDVFAGGFLLFAANVVSIILVGILVFLKLGLKDNVEPAFRRRAITITVILFLLTSVPLYSFLREYSFDVSSYTKAEEVLVAAFSEISPAIYLSDISTNVSSDGAVLVEAEVLLPEDFVISYSDRTNVKNALESTLNRDVDLRLRLQNAISVISEQDVEVAKTRALIEDTFVNQLRDLSPELAIDSLTLFVDPEDNMWVVEAILRGDPTIDFSIDEQTIIRTAIEREISDNIDLTIEIISRIQLKSAPDLLITQIKQKTQELVQENFPQATLVSVVVNQDSLSTVSGGLPGLPDTVLETVTYHSVLELKVPGQLRLSPTDASDLAVALQNSFDQEITVEFVTIPVTVIEQLTPSKDTGELNE